jgi:hypothetical protein
MGDPASLVATFSSLSLAAAESVDGFAVTLRERGRLLPRGGILRNNASPAFLSLFSL